MSSVVIPLTPGKNQSMSCSLPVDGANISLSFVFTYNSIGGYWYMSVTDTKKKTLYLDAVPLVIGNYPAANVLSQYSYLKLGSAWVIPSNQAAGLVNPTSANLGTDYVLIWSDTVG